MRSYGYYIYINRYLYNVIKKIVRFVRYIGHGEKPRDKSLAHCAGAYAKRLQNNFSMV